MKEQLRIADLSLVPFDEARIIDYSNIDTYGMFELKDEVEHILQHYSRIVNEAGCAVFTWGGDHTTSYVPMHVLGRQHGPLGIIHLAADNIVVHFHPFCRPDEYRVVSPG